MTAKIGKSIFKTLGMLFLLILIVRCGEDSAPVSQQEEHFETEGLLLYDETGNKILDYFQAESNDTLFVPLNDLTSVLQVKFYDGNKNEIEAPYEDNDHTFGWEIDDDTIVEVVRVAGDEWKLQLRGLRTGQTRIDFQVLHLGHADFRTIKIPVVVN